MFENFLDDFQFKSPFLLITLNLSISNPYGPRRWLLIPVLHGIAHKAVWLKLSFNCGILTIKKMSLLVTLKSKAICVCVLEIFYFPWFFLIKMPTWVIGHQILFVEPMLSLLCVCCVQGDVKLFGMALK